VETSANRGRRARLRLRTLVRGWPWYYETSPIFPREIILRAIPNTGGYFKESMGNWAVDPYAFEPNKRRDSDGMSFFRADFTTPEELANANRHPARARVAQITILQLRELGLDVELDPDQSQPAGHVIVPGMQFVANRSKEERRRVADLSQKLARFASTNGVYSPSGLPDPVRQS
jgi:hypothetical protein